ncbi:acetyl-CoA synthetase-like protein [Wolfiporia cocos MD-104 SS10]|uniref:Acetyl-CoA synthetase-like protein n=1 Tax=Wolfiporia cocos (strain MD-104) TaxID=742152 RepID=A0A2H3JTY9_WOLCO|nr:acetyl-CoA synthetase-like protein [Wolfiporia cocos MD-104 SS10]
MRVGARIVRERIGSTLARHDTSVVAVLAQSDAIPYATTVLGVMRASYAAFPISVRNSPAAVAHLLYQAGVRHVLVGQEQSSWDLARDALDILRIQHPSAGVPTLSTLPVFEELYFQPSDNSSATNASIDFEYKGPDSPVLILHSSGSTAFPKPIFFTQYRLLQYLAIPWFGERDLTDTVYSVHGSPMYHAMGIFNLVLMIPCGVVSSYLPPQSPPPTPTPEMVIRAAKTTDCNIVIATPAFIESWSQDLETVRWLAGRDLVAVGGGPLDKDRGDYLASQGVPLWNAYGSTEAGTLSVFFPRKPLAEWEYYNFSRLMSTKLVPYDEGTFELIMVANERYQPCITNTTVDGVGAYATSDLLAPHPTIPGYWRTVGRADDQIMHSTGEKTNPGPLESILRQDSHVSACVMFGRGRFQAGILVDPKPEHRFCPSDEQKLAAFRNMIWPTIERMNEYAPQHSRLFKEMIVVSDPSKPFQYTAKGTVRRGAMIKEYEQEIAATYEKAEQSEQSDIPLPLRWDGDTAVEFVRTVIRKVMAHAINDDDDLFQHSCDSLQATWIRRTILRALRQSAQIDTRTIVDSFVYSNPSIARLASFIIKILGGASADESTIEQRLDAMTKMVAKYIEGFPPRQGRDAAIIPTGDVILLTGSTGSLGCHILARLVSCPDVKRVYALNRSSREGISLKERQKAALVERGLNANIADSDKLVLLEGNITSLAFGVQDETYQLVCAHFDAFMANTHVTWRVDFNISLQSFEDNVKGLRHLVDFALKSPLRDPPRFIFVSSAAVFQNARPDEPLFETPSKADYAVGTGYAESKWVSEQILYEAAARTLLDPMVVRVDQVTGGLDGSWNAHEWFPAMVQSALHLGCFPDDHRVVPWIPLDIAAAALVDFRKASNPTHTVHLAHPRPVSWDLLAEAVAAEFSVPLVPYAEWLSRLEKASPRSNHSHSPDNAPGVWIFMQPMTS